MGKLQSSLLLYTFLGYILTGGIGCAGSKKVSLREIRTPLEYKEVSLDELVSAVNAQAQAIKTVKASIYIDFRSAASEKVQSIQSKLALERPDKVLLVSFKELLPTLFTMVSDGAQFWLQIPSKKEVFTGKAQFHVSNSWEKNPVYRLRPSHLIDALLLREIEPDTPSQFVYVEVLPDAYVLNVGLKEETDSKYYPQRRVFIEREDLRIRQYQGFNEKGLLVSDVTYGNYKKIGSLTFPHRVDIKRPWEGIELTLLFREVQINTDLNPKMFTFSLPKDYKVVELGN